MQLPTQNKATHCKRSHSEVDGKIWFLSCEQTDRHFTIIHPENLKIITGLLLGTAR